jgi:hypothetical protein
LLGFVRSLVTCADSDPDKELRSRYRQTAHALALASAHLPHAPSNSFVVCSVPFDGLEKDAVGRKRFEDYGGSKPASFWGKGGHQWMPEASGIGLSFLYFYSLWGDKEFLDLGRGIFERYVALPMPADTGNRRPLANMYTGVINLGVDLYLLTRDRRHLAETERVAGHAVRQLFRNGLFLDQPDLDCYEARGGGGALAFSLVRLHRASEDPNFSYERGPR